MNPNIGWKILTKIIGKFFFGMKLETTPKSLIPESIQKEFENNISVVNTEEIIKSEIKEWDLR